MEKLIVFTFLGSGFLAKEWEIFPFTIEGSIARTLQHRGLASLPREEIR